MPKFRLPAEIRAHLHALEPKFGFGGFGELVYYRTYSRQMEDGRQESWADTVVRVINGVFTIRKRHYAQNRLPWDEAYHQALAAKMAISMFRMEWLPPGRGLWIMGTDYVLERGSAALNNCGATTTESLAADCKWTMDMLMCGVGTGWDTSWDGKVVRTEEGQTQRWIIPDSREGWVDSVEALISAFTKGTQFPEFDYSQIREAGSPIRGFGGTASGPGPLMELHEGIAKIFLDYYRGHFGPTRLVADIKNSIGACVVAGNVRRSAQIGLGRPDDQTFLNLKNYEMYPERESIGWMSNNSVVLRDHKDFALLPDLAARIRDNGEPGLINLLNVQKYGRYGEERPDAATLFNPCFPADVKVWTADGHKSFGELAKEGKDVQVLTQTEGGELVYRTMRNPRLTQKQAGLVRVWFKGGESVRCTPNHRFFLKDGSGVEARSLKAGDSVDSAYMHRLGYERPNNHKVVKVEWLDDVEDVYCGTVDQTSRFFVALNDHDGVLVSNCGEQPLENKELCTLVEVFPSRCSNKETFLTAAAYATWYASTVTLLPTHSPETNAVMQRNRRIGVGIGGVTEMLQKFGASGLTRALRDGYRTVREVNKRLAREAGVPESIRVTTVKPSGSISQLVGCSPGAHFPTFPHAIRRVRVGDETPIGKFLKTTGLPYEPDAYSKGTSVFSFPIKCDNARPAKEVSAWEQFSLLAMLQREWSDNAVSQTIYFDPEREGSHVEHMLAQFAPLVKSVSMLPHTEQGAYKQMPYEGITRAQYRELRNSMVHVDWREFSGSDGQDTKFCTNDTCAA